MITRRFKAAGYSVKPTVTPSHLNHHCSWAWWRAIVEKGWRVLWDTKYPSQNTLYRERYMATKTCILCVQITTLHNAQDQGSNQAMRHSSDFTNSWKFPLLIIITFTSLQYSIHTILTEAACFIIWTFEAVLLCVYCTTQEESATKLYGISIKKRKVSKIDRRLHYEYYESATRKKL